MVQRRYCRRRLLGLAVFGIIAEVFFGYNVLLAYAVWGLPLLLVRRWTNRAVVIALLLCATSGAIRFVALGSYLTAVGRADQYGPTINAPLARHRAANTEYLTASRARDCRTGVTARIRHLADFYSQPFSYLPMGPCTLFGRQLETPPGALS